MKLGSVLIWITLHLSLSRTAPDCGIELKTDGKIVGGKVAGGFKKPWFALLHPPGQKSTPICSGALIDDKHIVTAAHCFSSVEGNNNTAKFGVTLGMYDRCKNESTQMTFNITKVTIHPNFTTPTDDFDIAIMTLNQTTNYTPICLPGKDEKNFTDRVGEILGWGETVEDNATTMPCELHIADLQVFTNKQCNESKLPQSSAPNPRVLCAGVKGGGVDSCQGDSGGPLQVVEKGAYVFAGIVSYGFGCGKNGYPGLYTNVHYFLDWIKENTSDDDSCED